MRSATSQGAYLNSSSFHYVHLGLTFESMKELGSASLFLVPIASKQLVYVLVHFFSNFLGFLSIFTPWIDYICCKATFTYSQWMFFSKSSLLLKVSCTLQIIFKFLTIIVLYIAFNLIWKNALLFNENAIHFQQHWHPNLMFDVIAFANF